MLNLRAELRAALQEAARRAQAAGEFPSGELPEVVVEHPPARGGQALGDYASPVALALARQWGREPLAVAQALVRHFTPPAFVAAADVAPPGFVNIRLHPQWLSAKIDDLIEGGAALGRSEALEGTSINLEFVSGNPTGELHMGNARALFTADVLGNVLAHAGAAITREYYVNDVGAQVEKYGESVLRRILEADGHAVDFPEGLYPGDDVRAVAAVVREALIEDRGHAFAPADLNDAALRAEVARRAVDTVVSEIRRLVEERTGVRYDVWFRESTLHERGDVADVLARLKQRGQAAERDGALWLKTTAFGDDQDRVLVKQTGETTYLASDIAYHQDKLRRGFQLLVDFWGADHQGHILPLTAGLKALGEEADRLRVVLVHLVRILQGGEAKKISKRAGTVVPLREVLDRVGLSAVRFFLTLRSLATPLDFDLDLAAAQREENPVYYTQYAYVRLTSILRKAKQQDLVDGEFFPMPAAAPGTAPAARVALGDPSEVRLLALALRLPEVLEDIVRTWEVQRLPQYALDLAAAVHRFYDTVPVLQAQGSDLLRTRLAFVVAVRGVLGVVCDLLGIEKREVM